MRIQEPEQRGERTVSVRKAVQLPMLFLAYRAPRAVSREAKVLNVIEFILLHGRSSRLYHHLIYEEQLAAGIGGGIHLRLDPSTFDLRFTARLGVPIETLQSRVYELLEHLREEKMSDQELRKAMGAIESDYIFSQESNAEIGHNLGEEECRGGWRGYQTWLDEHLDITAEEVRDVANEVFTERNRTVGYLIPDLTELDAAGPGDSDDTEGSEGSEEPS